MHLCMYVSYAYMYESPHAWISMHNSIYKITLNHHLRESVSSPPPPSHPLKFGVHGSSNPPCTIVSLPSKHHSPSGSAPQWPEPHAHHAAWDTLLEATVRTISFSGASRGRDRWEELRCDSERIHPPRVLCSSAKLSNGWRTKPWRYSVL